MTQDRFFCVNVNKYNSNKNFEVYRPASLDNPKNNAVMFIGIKFMNKVDALNKVNECLVFWPDKLEPSKEILDNHAIVFVEDPHNSFCRFFQENKITNTPEKHSWHINDGAFIEDGADVGDGCVIFPGTYIGRDVKIGKNCYIGSGVKIIGRAVIGNNVIIRENTVIGADSLTTDRDETGRALTMPQFGGVLIADEVQIGANTVVCRGAIDDTVICRGCKISNNVSICHNVKLGEDTFVVGESILFGSSSVGDRTLISGNSVLSNYVHVGDDSIIGQAAMVSHNIPSGKVATGNPARVIRDN